MKKVVEKVPLGVVEKIVATPTNSCPPEIVAPPREVVEKIVAPRPLLLKIR